MFSQLTVNAKNALIENNPLDYQCSLYEHCLQYAIMHPLSKQECGVLLELFSKGVAPKLLDQGYGEVFNEFYYKLKAILEKKGEECDAIKEALHQTRIDAYLRLQSAHTILNPFSLKCGEAPDLNQFKQSQNNLLQLLADTNALIAREKSLAQFFSSLNKIIHLSLSGYKDISFSTQSGLIAEALQFASIGFSLAKVKQKTEQRENFALLIDISLAHYFLLHMRPGAGEKTTFMLTALYVAPDFSRRLDIFQRMLNVADMLVIHAIMIAHENASRFACHSNLEKANALYLEILEKWALKLDTFDELDEKTRSKVIALGTTALSRINSITVCKGDRILIAELHNKEDFHTKFDLIPWQQNRNRLKNLRKQAKTSLTTRPIGDTLSIVEAYNQGLRTFLHEIFSQCLALMGKDLPFAYAILLSGSLSRNEACPYSDIEYLFLVEHNTETDKTHQKLCRLFLGFFEMAICAMGETPTMPVLEASKILLESGIPNGFQLDKNFKPYSNFTNHDNPELCGNADQLLLSDEPVNRTLMQSADLLLANEEGLKLYNQFRDKRSIVFQDAKTRKNLISRIQSQGNLRAMTPFQEEGSKVINIKEKLLQLPGFLLNVLTLNAGLDAHNNFDRLEVLTKAGILSEKMQSMIYLLLIPAFRLRYLAHFYYRKEDDSLYLSKASRFLEDNTLQILLHLRKVLIPLLYRVLSKTEALPAFNADNHHEAIPAILIIANDYFDRQKRKEAFHYYNLVLLLGPAAGMQKNESPIHALLKAQIKNFLLSEKAIPSNLTQALENYLDGKSVELGFSLCAD